MIMDEVLSGFMRHVWDMYGRLIEFLGASWPFDCDVSSCFNGGFRIFRLWNIRCSDPPPTPGGDTLAGFHFLLSVDMSR